MFSLAFQIRYPSSPHFFNTHSLTTLQRSFSLEKPTVKIYMDKPS